MGSISKMEVTKESQWTCRQTDRNDQVWTTRRKKNHEQSLKDLWDTKRSNFGVTGIVKGAWKSSLQGSTWENNGWKLSKLGNRHNVHTDFEMHREPKHNKPLRNLCPDT